MIFNCIDYKRDTISPKIHPTQKSVHVIKHLIEIFTDVGDVVIDPTAGSGITLLAAEELGRDSYGFEIKKEFVQKFHEILAPTIQTSFLNLKQDFKNREKRQMSLQHLVNQG